MKSKIHPTYYHDTKVTCSCGNTFITGSVSQNIAVEVCFKCHPFYTGEHRFVDTKGKVERFQKKQEIAKQIQATRGSKKSKKEEKTAKTGKTLKELLSEMN